MTSEDANQAATEPAKTLVVPTPEAVDAAHDAAVAASAAAAEAQAAAAAAAAEAQRAAASAAAATQSVDRLQTATGKAIDDILARLLKLETPTQPPRPVYAKVRERVAGYNIGGRKDYDTPTYQQELAYASYVILGPYRGWRGDVKGSKVRPVVQALKQLNPFIKVALYTNPPECYPNDAASADISAKVQAEDWWVRDVNGAVLPSQIDASQRDINITEFAKADVDGVRFPQWLARRMFDVMLSGVPELDAVFVDNSNWRSRQYKQANWKPGGALINARDDASMQPVFRRGIMAYVTELRRLLPAAKVWANPDGVDGWSATETVEYRGQFDLVICEGLIGSGYALESGKGWPVMMARYRSANANGGRAIFNIHGKRADYKRARYGIASALQGDGLICYSINDYDTDADIDYDAVPVFDEYDAPLGQPSGPAFMVGDASLRPYTNGMAVVNASRKSSASVGVEITLDLSQYNLRALSGGQDPVVNDGRPVTTVKIPPQDGRIYVKA